MHLAPEAAAGDEREALAALRELVGELHRDAAAERVADDGRLLVAEGEADVAQAAGERAERVVAARLRRLAVAEQVGGEDRVVAERASIVASHCAERPVIPWISRMSGPLPS